MCMVTNGPVFGVARALLGELGDLALTFIADMVGQF